MELAVTEIIDIPLSHLTLPIRGCMPASEHEYSMQNITPEGSYLHSPQPPAPQGSPGARVAGLQVEV
eukprot:CAMPEP_0184293782 /NCGR_PEP_ID=MMETSP1049-20130417/5130_1 /TAXON_ID=77928 /ORGANISM="Proteomonas sulcata, Strain CCMP704" /LENGTH=66 /DNA_ID=CAMNT_0026601851 /DNA_START=568 /DNA_END=768 /DNA_ORIENTATION=+